MTRFEPTLPSRASRHIPMKTKGSVRGAFVMQLDKPRSVVFESHLELKTALILLSKEHIIDLIDQPPPISYTDVDGKIRSHTPDYMVVLANGKRVVVAVKPMAAVERLNFRQTLGLIKAQMGDYADDLILVTDQSFTRAEADNAELLHEVRAEVDEEADEQLFRLIESLNSSCSIGQLIAASGLGGRAFRSIARLIAKHRCRLVGNDRISYRSMVEPKPRRTAN